MLLLPKPKGYQETAASKEAVDLLFSHFTAQQNIML